MAMVKQGMSKLAGQRRENYVTQQLKAKILWKAVETS